MRVPHPAGKTRLASRQNLLLVQRMISGNQGAEAGVSRILPEYTTRLHWSQGMSAPKDELLLGDLHPDQADSFLIPRTACLHIKLCD